MLVAADLHLDQHTQHATPDSDSRYPACNSRAVAGLEALRALYDRAVDEGHSAVVLAGDIFHRRGMVPVGVMNGVAKLVSDASDRGVTTYAIPGNHDYVDRDAKWAEEHLHSLFWLSGRIVIVSEPQVIRIKEASGSFVAGMTPYRSSREVWVEDAKSLVRAASAIRGTEPLILFGHQSLNGATVGPHEYVMREGISTSDIPKEFRIAAFGHYHQRQVLPHPNGTNVLYVGGLLQHNYGERTYIPGHLEVSGDAGIRYVDNLKSSRFDIYEGSDPTAAAEFLAKCAEAGWYGQVRWTGSVADGAALADKVPGHVVALPPKNTTLRMPLTGSETPEELVSSFVGHALATNTRYENSVAFAEEVAEEGRDILATVHRSGSV